ncbi:8-oxoguanine DNA glycosylase [Nesidiocoris tenuis]|uniref:DNA-(apurinic or apyrimidinic site) lyase n=1 Tax=Nesidiocoris tenuis TaxID=355587 RepID=A0ABN7B9W7_9HEMI|nr:8-oxoguanine DNA glycosylase [Nesidiocoris tenuis]
MCISGKINVPRNLLNLKLMLEGGQSFRWKRIEENLWVGVASKIFWKLRQYDDRLEYMAMSNSKLDQSFCKKFITAYLRLDEDLSALYGKWSEADENFRKVAEKWPGLRILDQDPVENLFSFICSSNNNISRISSMVEKMCKFYGEKVAESDGVSYYSFPPIESLAGDTVESDLRTAGFGYRAKYIHKSATQLVELGGREWLTELKRVDYKEAKDKLVRLQGIGPKVADCICLMSLGHLQAVPVDTHVFQIAQRYLPHLRQVKTCTPRIYSDITNYFQELYGPYSGWAHTILFCDDLKMFKDKSDESKMKIAPADSEVKIKIETDEKGEKTVGSKGAAKRAVSDNSNVRNQKMKTRRKK